MTKRIATAACGAALLLAGCGGADESRVPTADEDRMMNEISATLDNNQTFDTSPDSLVAPDEPVGNEAAAGEEPVPEPQ